MPPPSPQVGAVARRSRPTWIHGAPVDLLLFIGVPALLLPLILARPGRPAVQELILYLGAFGALGHHLPGMLRAYGDRELFARFRLRLVLAPIFLVAVCVGFSVSGLSGVVLVTFLWTTWHSLMQVYGFARIYDAKVGAVTRWTSRLDHALCVAWIGAPIAYSDGRFASALELWYRCGGGLVPAATTDTLRTVWGTATVALSAAFCLHLVLAWRQGVRANPIKLLFLGVSFGFWWFCMVAVDHLVAGIALFDVFHDVQYLALVWLFQRRRVDSERGVGGFTRFLFRRSGALVGLYVGLVLAYGGIGYLSEGVPSELVRNVLLGVLAASALFHFYLDGFIWKVREHGTRESLGIQDGPATRARGAALPGWAWHGLKWSLFVLPLGWLAWSETTRAGAEGLWRAALLESAPNSAEALTNQGVFESAGGDHRRAAELHRRAIAIKPTHPEAHHNLGSSLRMLGRPEEAVAAFEEALRLRPGYARAHGHLANVLTLLGRADQAQEHYRAAIEADDDYADPRANLGALLVARGDPAAAVPLFRAALAIEPDNRGALNNLAWILATSARADLRAPAEALELALALDRISAHALPQALDTLAAAQAAVGDFDEAARTAAEAAARARATGRPDLAAEVEARRAEYLAGRAWQQP